MAVIAPRRYTPIEYLIAIAVTSGAAIFKLYEVNDAPERDTQFVGIAFIMTYMVCDSFTSNWQSKVFKSHGVDSITMMMYANMFSTGFTSLGALPHRPARRSTHPLPSPSRPGPAPISTKSRAPNTQDCS